MCEKWHESLAKGWWFIQHGIKPTDAEKRVKSLKYKKSKTQTTGRGNIVDQIVESMPL